MAAALNSIGWSTSSRGTKRRCTPHTPPDSSTLFRCMCDFFEKLKNSRRFASFHTIQNDWEAGPSLRIVLPQHRQRGAPWAAVDILVHKQTGARMFFMEAVLSKETKVTTREDTHDTVPFTSTHHARESGCGVQQKENGFQ